MNCGAEPVLQVRTCWIVPVITWQCHAWPLQLLLVSTERHATQKPTNQPEQTPRCMHYSSSNFQHSVIPWGKRYQTVPIPLTCLRFCHFFALKILSFSSRISRDLFLRNLLGVDSRMVSVLPESPPRVLFPVEESGRSASTHPMESSRLSIRGVAHWQDDLRLGDS